MLFFYHSFLNFFSKGMILRNTYVSVYLCTANRAVRVSWCITSFKSLSNYMVLRTYVCILLLLLLLYTVFSLLP